MLTDQARMRAAGLVPIPFGLADEGCPGKASLHSSIPYGMCHTCDRFGRPGDQLEPALKLVTGTCQCVNWRSTEPVLLGGDRVHVLERTIGDEADKGKTTN